MATSYNGYPLVLAYGDPQLVPLTANGKPFAPNPGILGGDVGVVLNDLADWLDANIEPLDLAGYDKDDWCYTQKKVTGGDGSTWSCHFSATAFDYNAQKHGQHRVGTWLPWQKSAINAYLSGFLEGAVIWGENWSVSSIDGMHFEAGRNRALMARVADKIRRLSATPKPTPPPPTDEDDMPLSDSDIRKVADAVLNTELFYIDKTDNQKKSLGDVRGTLASIRLGINAIDNHVSAIDGKTR